MRPVVIQKDDLGHLSKKIDATTFLLVGEIHGVRENVGVIRSLLGEILKDFPDRQLVLAFEWDLTVREVKELNQYVHLKKDTFPTRPFFRNSDGRFSNEHKQFFDELRLKHQRTPLVITTFGTNISGDHEMSLAQRLLDQHTMYPNALILVETGVMHARKLPYRDVDGKEITPMAMYLEAELNTISLFLRYRSGEVVVEGQRRNITDAASHIEEPGDAFDYELVIDRATPDDEFL